MGVTGLWKLIEPCGEAVPVETLEGKILSVDISIWLHQVVKGFQDNKGNALPNAHLLGLFHRLCKLLYYRVRPVFVFDGCVPALKHDTIARRHQQRSKLNSEAERIQNLLLQSLAKEKVVQQALGVNAELLLKSPSKRLGKAARAEKDMDEMFKLPELPSSQKNENDAEDSDKYDCSYTTDETSFNTDDSSFDESNLRYSYNINLQAIDVHSKHFLDLPADIRHEILVDMKETRKQSSWGRLHELPSRSVEFSTFQMKRLLKRRAVQESLEEAEKEMGGRTLTYAELQQYFTEEGILDPSAIEQSTKPISSNEHTRFLLVRDLKKKLVKEEKIKELTVVEEKLLAATENDIKPKKDEEESAEELPSTFSKRVEEETTEELPSTSTKRVEAKQDEQNTPSNADYQADLQLAIALSLEDEAAQVYNKKDYEYESAEQLKLNREQRKELQNSAVGPARAYMIEYAGMNKEEVVGIMDKTQVPSDEEDFGETYKELFRESAKEQLENFKEKEKIIEIESSEELEKLAETSEPNILKNVEQKEQKDKIIEINCSEELKNAQEEIPRTVEQNQQEEISVEIESSQELNLRVSADEETDSDLEPVEDNEKISPTKPQEHESEELHLAVSDESETDSDLEEVALDGDNSNIEKLKLPKNNSLEIVVDLKQQISAEEDLFADIFEVDNVEDKESNSAAGKISSETISTPETKALEATSNEAQLIAKAPDLKTSVKVKQNTTDILSILDDLKQQVNDVQKISLDDIKINNSIIELSDEEYNEIKTKNVDNTEIIELCDSDDNMRPAQNRTPNKSPKLQTPSKNKNITEFFDTKYIIKRTPDKPSAEDDDENVPKVKSPFFVKRTPKSATKRASDTDDSPSVRNKMSKVSKSLFENGNKEGESGEIENADVGVTAINAHTTAEDVLQTAADLLKEQRSESELQTLATDLAKERRELENERNRQDRMGMTISQRMNNECQELLRLFGIPYIVAPMEAEAQCAFLDFMQLTNGTITDDSDIWLFGGRTVYKNFFAQNKHVLKFTLEKIEKSFNCDRHKLIQLACLVGSDYTTGVHGIGAVTAMEIIAAFSTQTKESVSNARDTISTIRSTLSKFREWWQANKSSAAPIGSSTRLALRKKLKNIEINEGFPSMAVIEAYLTPKVDENTEAFSWGYPDVESIREYAKKTFGWTTTKTNDILMPVMKKIDEKKSQATIRNYFQVKSALSVRELKVSKRVQKAIDKLSGKIDVETLEKPKKPVRKRATRGATKQAAAEVEQNTEQNEEAAEIEISESIDLEPSTSKALPGASKRRINLPNTKQVIPQREKDIKQMEENKKKAAAVMKNSTNAKAVKKTKKS